MKKLLVAMLIALSFVPATAFAAFDKNLSYGSRRDSVKELQQFLTDQGLYKGAINGRFLRSTYLAVRAFQKEEGIKPLNGIFNRATRKKAQAVVEATVAPETQSESASEQPDQPVAPTASASVVVPIVAPVSQPVVPVQSPSPSMTDNQTSSQTAPTAQPVASQPVSQAKLDIVSVDNYLRALNATHIAVPQYMQNSTTTNYDAEINKLTGGNPDAAQMNIGVVVYDANGNIVDNVPVTVTATDANQDKTLNGTGNVGTILDKYSTLGLHYSSQVPYYPYTYYFYTPGQHTITFSAEGITQSVTVTAQ